MLHKSAFILRLCSEYVSAVYGVWFPIIYTKSCARILFFVLLGFCDQTLFYDPYPISFPQHKLNIDISVYQFLNALHHYLSFFNPFFRYLASGLASYIA